MDGRRTGRGKTVYPPPPPGSGGIKTCMYVVSYICVVLYFVIFCSRINHEFENTWGLDTLHLYFFNDTSCDWCINKHLTVIVRSTCKYTHISKHMSYACL